VPIEQIESRGFNLDVKNPHAVELETLSPVEVLDRYREKQRAVSSVLEDLKILLSGALND
jgi:hypothetical protein